MSISQIYYFIINFMAIFLFLFLNSYISFLTLYNSILLFSQISNHQESNLLKYKELGGLLTSHEKQRWENIKTTFVKNNKLKGFGNANEMTQVLAQMMQFSENLQGIQEVLKKGLEK